MAAERASIKFVQAVEKFPCLYNHTIPEYSRRDCTEIAWSEVASETNMTVPDCKDKWKNIRNGFVRSLRPLPIGSSSKAKKPYYLQDEMQFIVQYIKPMRNLDTGSYLLAAELSEESNYDPDMDNENDEYAEDPIGEQILATDNFKPELQPSRAPSTKKMKLSTNEVDQAIVEYLHQKTRTSTKENERKMFLLSLISEVNELTENQMRLFKRKVLSLLDDIRS